MEPSSPSVLEAPRAPDIARNVQSVGERIARAAAEVGRAASEVALVAVSKTFPSDLIAAAHAAGVRHFGENWVQEAQDKLPSLTGLQPRPTWHMVGHLQANKAKKALDLFDIVQSVDSVRLGETLARRAGAKRVAVLLEVNVADESSKFGFRPEDLPAALRALRALPELELQGLMTVAPLAQNPEEVRPVFRRLRDLRDELGLSDLSMGMTDDFEIAIQEGATIVRIGQAIFGARPLE